MRHLAKMEITSSSLVIRSRPRGVTGSTLRFERNSAGSNPAGSSILWDSTTGSALACYARWCRFDSYSHSLRATRPANRGWPHKPLGRVQLPGPQLCRCGAMGRRATFRTWFLRVRISPPALWDVLLVVRQTGSQPVNTGSTPVRLTFVRVVKLADTAG